MRKPPDWKPLYGLAVVSAYFAVEGSRVTPPTGTNFVVALLIAFIVSMLAGFSRHLSENATQQKDDMATQQATMFACVVLVIGAFMLMFLSAQLSALVSAYMKPFRGKLPASPEHMCAGFVLLCVAAARREASPWRMFGWAHLCGAAALVGGALGGSTGNLVSKNSSAALLAFILLMASTVCGSAIKQIQGAQVPA